MTTVNVDPMKMKGEFSGTGIVVSDHNIIKGKFKCNICEKENIDIDDVWTHFKAEHYDDVMKRELGNNPNSNFDIIEDNIQSMGEGSTCELFMTLTNDTEPEPKQEDKKEVIYDKAITGIKKENIGRSIQKGIAKVGLPDAIKIWESKTGNFGYQFGFKGGI